MVDRTLILIHVCEIVHESDSRCFPETQIWDDEIDTRGKEFHAEFVNEIHDAMDHEVANIMRVRDGTNERHKRPKKDYPLDSSL
jgi:hypothetical protein